MNKFVILLALCVCCIHWHTVYGAPWIRAGAAKVNGTLVGLPLAGYNHGPRRVPYWPVPQFTEYTTFMTPSNGIINPTWLKALVIQTPQLSIAFITIDGIGSDSSINALAYSKAVDMGFTVPKANCIFSASHSHSGPGAVSPEMLWAMAPATDLLVPSAQEYIATKMAEAMVAAQSNLTLATLGVGEGYLVGVTVNRRAHESPYVQTGTIDPHLGVISLIDIATGNRIGTLWNYAVHGTCYGPDNMKFCGDIMGYACELIEEQIGGIALFVNGDAGDIDPSPASCEGAPFFHGSPKMAAAVVNVTQTLRYTSNYVIQAYSQLFPFGWTNLNFTFERFENCTSGGPLDICSLCFILQCDLNVNMPSSWLEDLPRFTGISILNQDTAETAVIVSIPGEALVELGWWIRNDTEKLGYDYTILAGYSNSHMGYFATPDEYDVGGYESQLTFWGIGTAEMVREGCKKVAETVLFPNMKNKLKSKK